MSMRDWDAALWAKAYRQAAEELGLPPRGAVGSEANRKRRDLGSRVSKRAEQLLITKQVVAD